MARKTCGAKTRSGSRCKRAPMPNGRCKLHGGATPPTNRNAAKPGSIYSKFLTEEEQALEGDLELGSVDAELRLMRIRLRRALAAETDTPELDETGTGSTAQGATSYSKSKRRDYSALIDRITGRIESLERRRIELQLMQLDADAKRLDLVERQQDAASESGDLQSRDFTFTVVDGRVDDDADPD